MPLHETFWFWIAFTMFHELFEVWKFWEKWTFNEETCFFKNVFLCVLKMSESLMGSEQHECENIWTEFSFSGQACCRLTQEIISNSSSVCKINKNPIMHLQLHCFRSIKHCMCYHEMLWHSLPVLSCLPFILCHHTRKRHGEDVTWLSLHWCLYGVTSTKYSGNT